MKIRLDLTKSNRFTVWESGGWDASKRPPFGNSVIVAGPDGEKLKIAFDVAPRENITQCAFFADIGQVLASCYITLVPGEEKTQKRNISLELARIEALTTEMVQGKACAVPVLKTLFVHRELTEYDHALELLTRYDLDKEGNRPEFKNLLWVAMDKAFTPLNEQRFFWAIPRDHN